MNAKIVAIGKYIPDRVADIQDVKHEERITDSKIERMKIGTVHATAPEEPPTSMAVEAARDALDNSNISPEDIDLVIYTYGFVPDLLAYPCHSKVQDSLGVKNATSFTVGQGCNGLVAGIEIAKALLEAGQYKNVLIAGSDKGHPAFGNRWHAAAYCVMGEGAAAAIMTMADQGMDILSTHSFTDGFFSDINYVEFGMAAPPEQGNFDFDKLRYDAVPQAIRFWESKGGMSLDFLENFREMQKRVLDDGLSKAGLTLADVDFIVDYNMSYEVEEALFEFIGFPIEKTAINLHEEFGHMGPSDLLCNLAVLMERGRIKKGDVVALMSAGSGLTWGSCLLKI